MKIILLLLIVLGAFVVAPAQHATHPQRPVGRWQIKFALLDTQPQSLVFTAQEHGDGSFQLLDTGPDNKPVPGNQAAAWSFTNSHLSVTGEVELQIGTCCREMGTLVFKGDFTSADAIKGKIVFITNVDEEESAYKYKSTIGTFTASRLK